MKFEERRAQILQTIATAGEMSIADLRKVIGLSHWRTATILQVLQREGLVHRRRHPASEWGAAAGWRYVWSLAPACGCEEVADA